MKVLRNKTTGNIKIVGNYGVTTYFQTKEEALKDYKRIKRNYLSRERRQVISDITGTSYAEAKRDMGL